MERKSDRAKSDGATDAQSDGAKSDGEKEQRSDGATQCRSDGENKRQIERKTKQISYGGTERQSDSNKTKISRLLNSYRKIDDIRDLDQGFSYAPTVSVLENYQQGGEACGVPGDAFDGVERR